MSILDSNKAKNAKNLVTGMPSKIFSNKEQAHITIPIEKEVNEKELMNLVATFICSREGLPIENASVGQESNHHVVQVKKGIPDKKGKISQVETVTVQFDFMPKACIVAFSTDRGKAENEKLKKTAGKAVAAEAGLIGAGTIITAATSGVVMIGLSPLAIAALPVAGVAVTAKALSASGKAKESRQLKDDVFAIICDYLGYVPDAQVEEIGDKNINYEQKKTVETVTQICECGAVLQEGAKFCAVCGKKVEEQQDIQPKEIVCECGNILAEGTKFCPMCGKGVID